MVRNIKHVQPLKLLKWVYLALVFWEADIQECSQKIIVLRSSHQDVFCNIAIANLCSISFSIFFFFFAIWVFFYEHSRITGLQGKGKGISLTPLYHFHQLQRHLDISRAITAESSPLHTASSRTRPGTFGFRAQVPNH